MRSVTTEAGLIVGAGLGVSEFADQSRRVSSPQIV